MLRHRSPSLLLLLLVAGACATPQGQLDLLEVTGFDTDLPATGLWTVETLAWAPDHPQAGEPEQVLHGFVLATAELDCDFLASTWDGGPAWEAYDTARLAGVTGPDLCELEQQAYLEQAESPYEQPGLAIQIQLWNTQIDDNHIGVEPLPGTYTALDGPDADVIEYAAHVTWTTENWAQRVAGQLDCSAEDPSDAVDWERTTETYDLGGPIALEPVSGYVDAILDVEIIEQPPGQPLGTVQGDARFDRCEVERVLDAPGPVG